MKRFVVLQLLGILLNTAVSLAVACFLLALQNWFGSSDISSFIYWTVPVAALVSAVGPAILKFISFRSGWVRKVLIVIVAIIAAIGWIYAVALVLGPWINTFSFSVLYPWIIGIATQLFFLERYLPEVEKKPRVLPAILMGLGLLLGVTVIVVGSSFVIDYLNRPAKETYLIPVEFSGAFRVVYGEQCGLNPPIKDGRRILRVPANGVLILQYPYKAGLIDNEYYRLDQLGIRTKAAVVFDIANGEKMPPHGGVMLTGSGVMSGAILVGAASASASQDIRFTDFAVLPQGGAAISERAFSKRQQQLDSLTVALVGKCRKPAR